MCRWASFVGEGIEAHLADVREATLGQLTGLSLPLGTGTAPRVTRLLRGAPQLTDVTLVGQWPSVVPLSTALAALPASLQSLRLSNAERVAPALIALTQTCPGLKTLALSHCALSAVDVAAIVDAGVFDRLTSLTLHHVGLDDDAAWRWARRRSPGAIRTLDLEEAAIGSRTVEDAFVELIDAGWLSGLEVLRVANHGLGRERLQHLLRTADVDSLRALTLSCTGLDGDDANALLSLKQRQPALRVFVSSSGLDGTVERAINADGP